MSSRAEIVPARQGLPDWLSSPESSEFTVTRLGQLMDQAFNEIRENPSSGDLLITWGQRLIAWWRSKLAISRCIEVESHERVVSRKDKNVIKYTSILGGGLSPDAIQLTLVHRTWDASFYEQCALTVELFPQYEELTAPASIQASLWTGERSQRIRQAGKAYPNTTWKANTLGSSTTGEDKETITRIERKLRVVNAIDQHTIDLKPIRFDGDPK